MSDSKMGRILKSIIDKAKADLEEQERKEAEMSEKTAKQDLPIDEIINELDNELTDILGNTKTTGKTVTTDVPTKVAAAPIVENKPKIRGGTAEKTGLERFCDTTWICFVQDGKFEYRDVETCTAKEFCLWLAWIYPPAESYLKEDMHYYEKPDNRKTAWKNIIGFLTRLPQTFKAYGESSFGTKRSEGNKKERGK